MRLQNETVWPDAEVRWLVSFAMKGVRTERLAVHLRNRRSHSYAYSQVPSVSPRAQQSSVDRLITLNLSLDKTYPHDNFMPKLGHNYGGKRSPLLVYQDWREYLVAYAAHEARHIAQFQHGWPTSEVDAEKWAAKRLDAYRRFQAGVPDFF